MTFHEFAQQVLAWRRTDGVRGIDKEENRYAIHIATAPFASMLLADIRARDLRDWVRAMQDKQCSRAERKLSTDTVKRAFALVSAVFGVAVERELVEKNPCAGIKIRKRGDEAVRDKWTYLTVPERDRITTCANIPTADRLAIRFAAGTGLRQGEMFHLELRDVHTDGPTPHVYVRWGSKGKPPKSGKTRKVPLFGDALEAAREWLEILPTYAKSNPDEIMWPTANGARRGTGKPLGRRLDRGAWEDAWQLAKREAGITRAFRWHDLRHTFASWLVAGWYGRKWTLIEVRDALGHSSVTITERYAHLSGTVLEEAARATVQEFAAKGPENVRAYVWGSERMRSVLRRLRQRAEGVTPWLAQIVKEVRDAV